MEKVIDSAEIVRLHREEKMSFREIGRALGISHVAVRKKYLKAADEVNSGIQPPTETGIQVAPNESVRKDSTTGVETSPKVFQDPPTSGAIYFTYQRYLRKVDTGEIFAFAERLLTRQKGDMEEVRFTGDGFILVTPAASGGSIE